MKRRVGALLMALVLIMTGFAAYAEEGQPAEVAVEDSLEDASVSEEEPEQGEDAPYEEEPVAAVEEPAELTEPEVSENVEAVTEAQTTVPEETQSEAATEPETPAPVEEETEEDIESYTAQKGSLSVTVEAPKGALPENVLLNMQIVDADSEEYEEVQSYVKEQEGESEETYNLEIADIYFTLDGEKVDPSEAVTVKLALTAANADTSSLKAWDYTDRTQGTFNAETQEVEFVTANLQTFAATWEDGNGTAIATYSALPSDEEEESNSELSIKIIETSSPEDGEAYQKGEELNYYIEVENIGEVDLYNIVVKDYLSARSWEINSLSANGGVYTTQEDEISYMITTLDAENGSVNIEVEAVYSNVPQNSELRTYSDHSGEHKAHHKKRILCSDQKENLNPDISVIVTVTSTPKDGVAYREGEELTYYVTVENSGNVDLVDIVVIDNLSGENWEIDSLPWGGEYSTEDDPKSYVISEKDAKTGKVYLKGTASAKYSSNNSDHGKTFTWNSNGKIYNEEILTHQIEELTVTITLDHDRTYKEGDKIEYTVTVKNTGNFTVSDIQVTNSPVDKSSEGSWTIKSLEPTKFKNQTIVYTVTGDDTLKDKYDDNPSITFTAKAEGQATLADGSESVVKAEDEQKIDIESVPQKFVDTDQDPDKKDENRDYNDDGKEVESGDTLVYLITYENTDTETKTVTIKDKLENSLKFDNASKGGTVNDKNEVTWTFEAAPLEAGYVTLTTEVKEDVVSDVKNSASVKVGDNKTLTTNTVENPIKDKDPEGPWKSVDPPNDTTVTIGKDLTYTIRYFNHHSDSETVIITDELDEGLTYNNDSATKGGSYNSDTRTITWEVTADPFSYGEVTFSAKVNSAAVKEVEEIDKLDYEEDDDDNDDDDEGNSKTKVSAYEETISTGEVENTAYVKIGDDEKKATDTVKNPVSSTSESSGSGSGSDGEGSSKNTAVNTADDTPVAPMAVLFGTALVVLGADIIYRRRRTQR